MKRKFTDLVVREIYTPDNGKPVTVDHPVHKHVLYEKCEFFKMALDFKDKDLIVIDIGTKTPVLTYFINYFYDTSKYTDLPKSDDEIYDCYKMAHYFDSLFIIEAIIYQIWHDGDKKLLYQFHNDFGNDNVYNDAFRNFLVKNSGLSNLYKEAKYADRVKELIQLLSYVNDPYIESIVFALNKDVKRDN